MDKVEANVAVLGSGLAGLAAALTARRKGARVVLLSDPQTPPATALSGGNFRASIEGYPPEQHFLDTVTTGAYLSQRSLAKVVAQDAVGIRALLADVGVATSFTKVGFRVTGAACPGEILIGAFRRSLDGDDVRMATALGWDLLLKPDGSVAGVLAYDPARADWLAVVAPAVIVATGGAAGIYEWSTNSRDAVGDGLAMCFRAGAVLADMEFVQFWPLATTTETAAEPCGCLDPEEVAGGTLLLDGSRDITARVGLRELAGPGPSRAAVARRVYEEIVGEAAVPSAAGNSEAVGGTRHSVLLGPRDGAAGERELALTRVTPAAHHTMGGVVCGDHGQTRVPGLYVAGEAGTGAHGADRLSGSGLTEALVMGCRAGALATALLADRSAPVLADGELDRQARDRVRRALGLLEEGETRGPSPAEAQGRIRRAMWQHAALARTRDGLDAAQSVLNKVKRALPLSADVGNGGEVRAGLKALNMLLVAETVTRSARYRKESRGVHFRADYPQTDDSQWLRHVRVRLLSGEISLDTTEGLDLMEPVEFQTRRHM